MNPRLNISTQDPAHHEIWEPEGATPGAGEEAHGGCDCILHNLPTMASGEEGATIGAREEGYWNKRYDDTGQKETAQI